MGRSIEVFALLFLLLFIERLQPSFSRCIASERKALLEFKNGLVDESNRLQSWHGEDCCSWAGVGCCNKTSHVLRLDLRNPFFGEDVESKGMNFIKLCLGGKISSSLLELKHLKYLDLSSNYFSSSPIPSFFRSIEKLEYLNLSSAAFAGNIPNNLGNLSSLRYLDLGVGDGYYENFLSANNLHWLSNLPFLIHLDLSFSDLSASKDWLYAVNGIPSLQVLCLGFCRLTELYPSLRVNFTSLSTLDLSSNDFQYSTFPNWLFNITNMEDLNLIDSNLRGFIPGEMASCKLLKVLNLAENALKGKIPLELWSLCNLHELYLGGNGLSGEIFGSFKNTSACIARSLRELHLSSNMFDGYLPEQLASFNNLEVLDLSSNSFMGPILSSIAKLPLLRKLWLRGNKLSGCIPESVGQLSKLEALDISNNSLRCSLSVRHFEKLVALTYMDTSSNSILWDIGQNWTPPFQLRTMDLSSNIVGPQFHQWLQTQSNLNTLFMSNMGYLKPTNNNFTRIILSLICNLSSLVYLDLTQNQLSGEIPNCWRNLQHLRYINLGNNSLTGQIPKFLVSLPSLHSLHLNTNNLSGKLPKFPKIMTNLAILDLSYNNFVGTIPSQIGENLFSLEILDLQSNRLSGKIPMTLCQLPELHLLNLGHNNFTGSIPHCVGNFTAMVSNNSARFSKLENGEFISSTVKGLILKYNTTYLFLNSIDFSNNSLVGSIPEELMNLSSIENLNLSGNYLKGSIPMKINGLKKLESLDLSKNQLTGPIPQSLSSLNFLSHMNLSFNNLSGPIPSGTQLQTFNDESIYMGNSGLCGPPLPRSCFEDKKPRSHGEINQTTNEDDPERLWFYGSIGLGFLVGLLGVCGTLFFNKYWRYAYFHFVDNMYNKVYVMIAVKVNKLKQNF